MSDYLQRYLPEFNEDDYRTRLTGFSHEELLEMLIRAYKEKRVIAKVLDEETARLTRVREVLDAPSKLNDMPDVPGADDLRKMME